MAEVESTGARRGLDFLAAALHQAATLTLRGAVDPYDEPSLFDDTTK